MILSCQVRTLVFSFSLHPDEPITVPICSRFLRDSRAVPYPHPNLCQTTSIKPLKGSERLRKHIERLAELTEPESLETENEEEAVNEFDERLAGAKAKTTLISKIVGESSSSSSTPFVDGGGVSSPGRAGGQSATAAKEMPSSPDEGVEVDMTHAVRPASGSRGAKPPKRSGEMEDFVGLPQVKKASN
ncbi:hypothetical protein KC329_g10437 [Hortaea werneckii]|nr:hypothetical protein KC329_g10437 [Hortaea werneckii]